MSSESEPQTAQQRATEHLGTVVRHHGDRWQVVAIEDAPDDDLTSNDPTLVGEKPDGTTYRWGLSIFEDLEVVTDELDAPERPEPVVPISVQDGLVSESKYYQDNAVVRCNDCGELVREPDATPAMGDPTDAHDHDHWRCDSCSPFADTEANPLDVSEADLEACPYARWSDRLQAWTIGSDYRVDDGKWRPDCVEPATVDVEPSGEVESDESVLIADGGVESEPQTDHDVEDVKCAKCGQSVDGDWEDNHPEPLCYGCSHGQNEIEEARR